ncbi:two-component sensor histidine kinase [Sphaerisporangium krabiense]|uniref:histidine kinase n=1 Tax=Sphaerisporangium krabiense TaxID=763782 RepID=A0A7W8YZ03_9ACTN|nr:histidine kinase [Sphaerisporangium krabiense]MBB5624365.1 signal transduction histidine kinase [Sphaerisporangium krabiense]GII61681.1 two-component sensor histidine kinase [Sphaerisporangium krabiense]
MFGRLRALTARHSRVANALLLVPLIVLSLISADAYSRPPALPDGTRLTPASYLGLSALLIVPLLWRRSRPVLTFAAVAAVSFAQWLMRVDVLPGNLAVLVAMYGVASRCAPRWAIAAGLVAELGACLSLARWQGLPFGAYASASMFVVAPWVGGIYASVRRRYLESLEERAMRAERERDQQARIAAAAERARIARELHDVVAHNVSVMIVQADGAGYTIDSDPEKARRAVQTISSTGRQALAEMRRLVGVLREDAGPEEEYAPQPGVAELDDLVAQVRRSGLPVEYTVKGAFRDLPEGEQLVIYRIVQEALTNALKHGGPGARATVEMEYGAREILLRVTDDGRGAAAPAGIGGHGLVGMRERVAMYDGSVKASPRPGGGFQVAVRLPVSRAA